MPQTLSPLFWPPLPECHSGSCVATTCGMPGAFRSLHPGIAGPAPAEEPSRGSAGPGVEGAWAVCHPVLLVKRRVRVEGGPGCSGPHAHRLVRCRCHMGGGSFPVSSRTGLSIDFTFLTGPKASCESREGTVGAACVRRRHAGPSPCSLDLTRLWEGGREAGEASAHGNGCEGFALCPANPTGTVPTV